MDAMAADAHGNFLPAGFGVALDLLGMGREGGHRSDSQGKHRGQQLVHFAYTIQLIDKNQLQIISGWPS
jgi:hypothetical protein